MKSIICSALFCLVLMNCHHPTNNDPTTTNIDEDSLSNDYLHPNSFENIVNSDSIASTSEDSDYEEYYILILDSGYNYHVLDVEMYAAQKIFNISIDTMNRYFSTSKNQIILRENDEDNMYAGEYFPRRFTGESLSIEYAMVFNDSYGKNKMVLVAGIYDSKSSADSLLRILKPKEPKVYIVKAKVFVGCMH